MMKRLLFKMAKGPQMGRAVGWAFQHASWAIPVRKVPAHRDILAFHHPHPSYDHHLILSPKRAVRDLRQLASDDLNAYLVKVWETAKALSAAQPEYHDAFALVANGGRRQEVQQVHFHLFTGHDMVADGAAWERATRAVYRDQAIRVLEHPDPDWELHWVTRPVSADQAAYFRGVLQCLDPLDARFHLTQRGYSLVYQHRRKACDMEWPVFHIVAGKRLK